MIPKLRILSNVVERLHSVNTSTTGRLYGLMYNNTLTIITFSIAVNDDEENNLDHTVIQLSMPTEIDLCGVLYIGQCEEKLPDAFQDIDITDNPLLLKYIPGEVKVQAFFYIHQKLEKVKSIEIINEEDIYREFTYIRLQASFPLISKNWNVKDILLESRKSIASGKVAIWFPSNNIYVFNSDDNSKSNSLKELLSMPQISEGHSNRSNRSKPIEEFASAVNAKMFFKVSTDAHSEDCLKYAPALKHIKCSFNSVECKLKIDALSLVSQDITPSELYDILVESICRNIKLIEKYFEEELKDVDIPKSMPEPLHYKPRGFGHLFTVVHPQNDNNTSDHRRSLHKALSLDMTRPYFRRWNQVKFYNEIKPNEPLINPHSALFTSDEQEKTSLVHSLYSYHHYMQDDFDDNGWGCAYRSLQTIVSWYRLQGYTNIPIPTHRKIQECLVDIGDKPYSFIGSKQWIGSTEVGFVLETMLGISIKILCASSGEDMVSYSSNLAHHFQTQGTPVMIGGGVLAHTILGVSQNESTGQVKFLILDPHYTGPDNLNTILNKGWCGWKTSDFWKKDAFYNMCLPQRPICI